MRYKIIKNSSFIAIIALIISGVFGLVKSPALASMTSGSIDSANKYAWTENAGWVDFGVSNGGVTITDSALTGYAFSESLGWISLHCSNGANTCSAVNFGVINDGLGNLSGYAWSENAGWINFAPSAGGVTINSAGEFSGSAFGENIGWIIFNCATTDSCAAVDYKITTDWRPPASRPQCSNTVDDDRDGLIDYPADFGCSSLSDDSENITGGGGITGSFGTTIVSPSPLPSVSVLPSPSVAPPSASPPADLSAAALNKSAAQKAAEFVESLVPEFLKPKEEKIAPTEIPIEKLVPQEAPLALRGQWKLLAKDSLNRFALAPLPLELGALAQKFPALKQTFAKVGVNKLTDVAKLSDIKMTLPGLSEAAGLPKTAILLANMTPAEKQKIPTEIIFARLGQAGIDLNIGLTVNVDGRAQQKIKAMAGRTLSLAIKPEGSVRGIKGYLIFKSKKTAVWSLNLPLASIFGSLFFGAPALAQNQAGEVPTEEKLVLAEFDFLDPDGDGIYTVDIRAPAVEGEYEIITVLDYVDPELGRRAIRLITVVDPDGYVFEAAGEKETRVLGAVVSIFWLNPESKKYELWPAKDYQQQNPQITDVTGRYAFLVPAGDYYLEIDAPGYLPYEGKPFEVGEGGGVHQNIELKTKYWYLKAFDWKTILLILVAIFLAYNFYKDKISNRAQRLSK